MDALRPNPIPPRSVVSVAPGSRRYQNLRGQKIRIGYYSPQDGLDCIWLVYPNAEYGETTDHEDLYRCFVIEQLSDETDFYGHDRDILLPL